MNCDYAAICYNYYANEIAECFELSINRTCEHLLQTSTLSNNHGFTSSNESISEHEDITIGLALFDVYLVLKCFAEQSVEFCPDAIQLEIHNYHDWFVNGVSYWLDMHHYTAFTRIKKAIEMDTLKPIDEMVKYSSSAIDTMAIFQSIKEFWLHLNWPDIENEFTFMAKIVDNICNCYIYYADKMANRILDSNLIENIRCDDNDEFYVTPNLCIIINNIEYLLNNLSKFIMEFNINDIIEKLAIYRSHTDAQRCQLTMESIVENAIDTIENQIVDLIENISHKMCTHLHKCIRKAADHPYRDTRLIDQLMENLEKSLYSLSTNLNEINFQQILAIVWQKFKIFFKTLLQNSLNVRIFYKLLMDKSF